MNSMVPSRRRRGLVEIQLWIAEFKSSGLSKTEFAERLGFHPLSMDRWLRIIHPTQLWRVSATQQRSGDGRSERAGAESQSRQY